MYVAYFCRKTIAHINNLIFSLLALWLLSSRVSYVVWKKKMKWRQTKGDKWYTTRTHTQKHTHTQNCAVLSHIWRIYKYMVEWINRLYVRITNSILKCSMYILLLDSNGTVLGWNNLQFLNLTFPPSPRPSSRGWYCVQTLHPLHSQLFSRFTKSQGQMVLHQ